MTLGDKGLSGTSLKKRDNFNKMIAACKRGRIDTILTKSLSRFARNTVDCLETVRMLRARGIGVIFEKENINTLTESNEFLITLFSGFAQAESESLSGNIARGKMMSMQTGNVPFQYKKLLGYREGEDGKPEIDPEEAKTVRRIYRRYLDGCSLSQIQRELEADHVPTAQGVQQWSYQIIHNILTNERYIGDALLGKTYVLDCISKEVRKNNGERPQYYVENNHPAIIPREWFQRVKEEMTRRASKRKVMQRHGKSWANTPPNTPSLNSWYVGSAVRPINGVPGPETGRSASCGDVSPAWNSERNTAIALRPWMRKNCIKRSWKL